MQGHTLDHHTEGERLTPPHAAELVAALAEAAHSAHRQGIVHQDIKPRNVLIDGRGQPRLIDFGLAWFRSPGSSRMMKGAGQGLCGTFRPSRLIPRLARSVREPTSSAWALCSISCSAAGRSTTERLIPKSYVRPPRRATTRRSSTGMESRSGSPRSAARPWPEIREPGSRPPLSLRLRSGRRCVRSGGEGQAYLRSSSSRPSPVDGCWANRFALGPPRRRKAGRPAMEVQVWRPDTHFSRLSEALPVHTGDELQVRFRVPPGLHIGLCSINGRGGLTLLQRYPPQKKETELVYPGPDQTSDLKPPAGTEILLVCGRSGVAVTEAELQAMWDGAGPWPALEPPGQLLRIQRDHLREEGERSRDFGATHVRPGSDTVSRRLDGLRERLRPKYAFFEGLAFAQSDRRPAVLPVRSSEDSRLQREKPMTIGNVPTGLGSCSWNMRAVALAETAWRALRLLGTPKAAQQQLRSAKSSLKRLTSYAMPGSSTRRLPSASGPWNSSAGPAEKSRRSWRRRCPGVAEFQELQGSWGRALERRRRPWRLSSVWTAKTTGGQPTPD